MHGEMKAVSQRRLTAFGEFLIQILMLCWPIALNQGHPLVFSDTRSYFTAGRAAIDKVAGLLHPHVTETIASGSLDVAIQKARAVRSVFYSIFIFLTASISLWLVVLLQATTMILLLRLALRSYCPNLSATRQTWFIFILAMLTTVSWLVSTAMPDVFTPVAVLATILALLFWTELNRITKWLLFVCIAGGTVMHLSNPPIVFGLLCVAAVIRFRRVWPDRGCYLMVVSALVVALVTTLAASVIGFKQWTLAPNQPPFLLARSIADGPGRLYLQRHCPHAGFAMCNHLDRLNVGADDFIWHENGVYSIVPLDEAAKLRTEEKHIFVAAALEHPWMQIKATAYDWLEQLSFFTLQDFYVPSYGHVVQGVASDTPHKIVAAYTYAGADSTDLDLSIRPTEQTWQMVLAIPEYLVVIVALGYAIIIGWSDQRQRDLLVLVLAAISLNALVAAFSVASARYEARVIWLIPLTALLFVYRRRGSGNRYG